MNDQCTYSRPEDEKPNIQQEPPIIVPIITEFCNHVIEGVETIWNSLTKQNEALNKE